jgi:Oxidoreductase family, NAD-binding Rossmann fold/Oxidoreductase family, C-terminal alpha/beta domain
MNKTRRSFLKSTGLAAGALGFPNILHAQNKGDKLRVALIASGGKGNAHLSQVKAAGDIVTCIADVDKRAWDSSKKDFPQLTAYQDYRQLFDKEMKNIDTVMIATPDHHHFLPTVLAMQGGKHCYTQKPLTHTVWEARQLHQGVQKLKLATQMGNQGHSNAGNRRIYEFVNSGMLGDIKEIHCVSNRPIWPQGQERPEGQSPIPEWLDWDLWLGPAAARPFKGGDKPEDRGPYHPFNWRGWYEFGGGALADMACHTMDSIFMSMVPGYPVSVEVLEIYKHSSEMFPSGSIIKWTYGPGKLANGKDRPGFDVYWYDGKLQMDGKEVDASDVLSSKVPAELLTLPDGQKMTLKGSGNLYVGTKCGLMVTGDYGDRSRIVPVAKAKEVGEPPKMLERIGNGDENAHYSDWRVACTGEKPWDHPGSNFTYAAPFTETILLGNIALRVGKGKVLNYDGPNMKFTNSDEANKYITKEYRSGWGIKLV